MRGNRVSETGSGTIPASGNRLQELLVLLLGEQPVELALILEPELHEPAASGRILVDGARRTLELAVDLDDVARNGRVDLARSLHALDDGRLATLGDRLADGGKLHIDHVPELLLGVVGDPDHAG